MKAAVIEGPGRLRVREVGEPTLEPYQVRCDLLYGAVCAGTDNHLVAGDLPFRRWFTPPSILGHETIGRVRELGSAVRHLRVGDLVTRVGAAPHDGLGVAWGGFAEHGVGVDWRAMAEDGVPREQWARFRIHQRLPETVDPAAATMMITWRETWSYLHRLGIGPDMDCLIVGSGGNALAFAAHARNAGAEVSVIGSPRRRKAFAGIGVGSYHDYADETAEADLRAVHPEGCAIAVDTIGTTATVRHALGLLAHGGSLGIYGHEDPVDLSIPPSAARGSFTIYRGGKDEAEAHDAVVAAFTAGDLDASHWLELDRPFELAQIEEAVAAARERRLIKPLVRLSAAS